MSFIFFSTEHLNSQFIQFLLHVIEDGLPSDSTDQLPDLFINVLLAFNLHIPGQWWKFFPAEIILGFQLMWNFFSLSHANLKTASNCTCCKIRDILCFRIVRGQILLRKAKLFS